MMTWASGQCLTAIYLFQGGLRKGGDRGEKEREAGDIEISREAQRNRETGGRKSPRKMER